MDIEKYLEKCVEDKIIKYEAMEKRHREKMEHLKKIEDLLEKMIEK